MKTIHFIAVAALLLEGHANAASVFAYNAEAFENEQVLRFWFQRDGDTDLVQTVEYFTKDGTARSGVHYIASTGTVTFAVGQSRSSVEVPLIDNGLVDGEKFFEVVPHRPGSGVTIAENNGWNCNPFWLGTIRDNELPPTRVDPLFVPEVSPDDIGMVGEMPDGRILISGGRDGIAMLFPNGLMDSQFFPRDALVLGQRLAPVHIFRDGRILTQDGSGRILVRLSPNGALEQVIHLPLPGYTESDFVAAQPDGKILLRSPTKNGTQIVLHRVNPDGSRDATFMEASFISDQNEALSIRPWSGRGSGVVIQPDAKILVAGTFRRVQGVVRSNLARLNPDGSLDHTFSPVLARSDGRVPEIFGLLGRRNGKVIVTGYFQTVNGADRCCFAQLNSDGSLDSSFNPPSMFADWDKGFFHYGLTVEQPDGRLIISPTHTSVMRLNADGSVDPTFAADLHSLPVPCQVGYGSHGLGITASGDLLLAGYFDQVDGFPRNRFVRLLDMRPQNDFRVVTPAEFYRSSGVARLEVVRTGPTTNAASVSFSTRDETAKAGEDYVSHSGTLNFAPLEVSKEVTVPLLDKGAAVGRLLTFGLELRNPSTAYTTVGSTPIIILSALRMAPESILQRVDGSFAVTLQGTVPGVRYILETSTDLNSWEEVGQNTATGSMTAVKSVALPLESLRFFRARSE